MLPSGPVKQRGGFVGRHLRGRLAGHGDDPVAVEDAGGLGRAVRDHVDDQQGPVVGLELDAQTDKVAFDLRVNVAELVGGEERRVVVEARWRPRR